MYITSKDLESPQKFSNVIESKLNSSEYYKTIEKEPEQSKRTNVFSSIGGNAKSIIQEKPYNRVGRNEKAQSISLSKVYNKSKD